MPATSDTEEREEVQRVPALEQLSAAVEQRLSDREVHLYSSAPSKDRAEDWAVAADEAAPLVLEEPTKHGRVTTSLGRAPFRALPKEVPRKSRSKYPNTSNW